MRAMTRAEKQILVAGIGNALLQRRRLRRRGRAAAARSASCRAGVTLGRLRHRRARPGVRGDARLRRAGARRRQPPGRRAGTLYVMEAARRTSPPASRTARWSTRTAMDPETVLRFVRAVGGWPGKVIVIACEPAEVEELGHRPDARGRRRPSTAPSSWSRRRSTSCSPTRPTRAEAAVHELSLAGAVIDTATRHADGRRVTAVHLRVGHLRQVVPDSLAFYFEHVAAGHAVRGRAAGARGGAGAAAVRRVRSTGGSSTRPSSAARPAAPATSRSWRATSSRSSRSTSRSGGACTA